MTRRSITIEIDEDAAMLLESLAAQAGQHPDHYGALVFELAIAQNAAIERRAQKEAKVDLFDVVAEQLRFLGVLR